MKKEEFLSILRKRLNILEDTEIEDIISEYEGYFEEKLSIGKTEEEAIKELGDIDEIVRDLLAAYKVKSPNKEENGLTKFINKIMYYLDKFIEELNNRSAKDIIRFIIEICIILLLISLFKISFNLLKNLGWNIFSIIPSTISSIFYSIWAFIIEVSYFIISLLMFIKIIEKRYFKLSETIVTSTEEDKKEEYKPKKKNNNNKEEKIVEEIKVEKAKKEKNSFLSAISNICIIFLKFIVLICLIGVIAYLIAITFALGLMIYLLINGVKYFGIAILFIALIQTGALLLELGTNFISNKKQKTMRVFGKIISIVILTGVGLTFSTVEIANTEIIYDNYYQNTKEKTKEITMQEDLVIQGYDNIKIDNSLGNTIKIVYSYPDLENIDLNIELGYCGYNCHNLKTNFKQVKWNKALLEDIIKNLKAKKIYSYEFYIEKTIYLSSENYAKLIENNDKYDYYEDKEELKIFTRTYNVISVEESNTYEYLYLTVKQFQFEEIETIRVLRSIAKNVIEGKNYEFTFEYSGEDYINENDIEEIFDECKIQEINYTDKIGLDQIQESIS